MDALMRCFSHASVWRNIHRKKPQYDWTEEETQHFSQVKEKNRRSILDGKQTGKKNPKPKVILNSASQFCFLRFTPFNANTSKSQLYLYKI